MSMYEQGPRMSNGNVKVIEPGMKVWARPEPIKPVVDGEDKDEEEDVDEVWDPKAEEEKAAAEAA